MTHDGPARTPVNSGAARADGKKSARAGAGAGAAGGFPPAAGVAMRRLLAYGLTAGLLAGGAGARAAPPSQGASVPPAGPATQSPQSAPTKPDAPPPVPLVENLRAFDPGTLDVTWSDNRWRLTVGGRVLKDFGRREAEARQALRLARTLGLSQYGTVGAPDPLMEYWLADGKAPRGPVTGCPVIAFDAASLHVEESLGQWCVRDDRRVLFNFGARPDAARQAFAVLRKYGFGQVAVVGQLAPSMFVFLAPSRDAAPNEPGAGKPARALVTHEPPEAAAKKAAELKRLKDRYPTVGAETVAQPALRPLRTPDQPRQAFSVAGHSFRGEGAARDAADAGGRVGFDWRLAQVRLDGREWKLTAGSLVLADFGPDQEAARRALDVIRYYHFTEQCRVGQPEPRFTYFLVNGLAPRGVPFGVPSVPFRPDALKARPAEGGVALCDGDRALITLGGPDEAADLLAVIRRQRFDLLCHVGPAEGGLSFLAKAR